MPFGEAWLLLMPVHMNGGPNWYCSTYTAVHIVGLGAPVEHTAHILRHPKRDCKAHVLVHFTEQLIVLLLFNVKVVKSLEGI